MKSSRDHDPDPNSAAAPGADEPKSPEDVFAGLIAEGWQHLGSGEIDESYEHYQRAAEMVSEQRAPDGSDAAGDADVDTDPGASLPRYAIAEIWALGGALMAVGGKIEGGLEQLRRAVDAFPAIARYPLWAAEVTMRFTEDLESTMKLCDRVLDLTSDEDELIEAVILKAEALVGLGDRDEEARELLGELEGCAVGDPSLLCHAGDMHFTLGDLDGALRAYGYAATLDPEWADAHHGIGMVHESRGDRAGAAEAWLRTLALDLDTAPEPWHMSPDEFETVAESALAELPPDAMARLENVPVFIEDAPSKELVAEGTDPRLFGLFSGIPLPAQSHIVDGQVPHIDSIHIYQRNLERSVASRQQLIDEIRITVLHETAHFFGLEDDDLDAIGLG